MTKETVTVQKDRIPYLREKLVKLNRKCHKLNCPDMILTVHEETEIIRHELRSGRYIDHSELEKISELEKSTIKRTWVNVDITLEYEIPIIDGWELVCTFDIVPGPAEKNENGEDKKDENDNVIYGPPVVFTSKVHDKELPARFLDKHEIHCGHCGHNRYRTHSMLMIKTESGRYKEVGSTCIKDFFGHDPKNLLWMAQISLRDMIDDVERDDFGSGSGVHCYDLDQILRFTALSIRKEGWVSKGAAYDDPSLTPTAEMIWFYIDPLHSNKIREFPSTDDIDLANAAKKYFEEIDAGENDYLINCKKVVALGYVPLKMIGVTCSMIATYRRELAKDIERKKFPESQFVGEVGDKVEATVKCVWLTECQSQYGVSVLYIFVNETTGEKFKTFYSGNKWSAVQGDIVELKGTVKKHEEYKGSKDTMLTRCFGKIIEAK